MCTDPSLKFFRVHFVARCMEVLKTQIFFERCVGLISGHVDLLLTIPYLNRDYSRDPNVEALKKCVVHKSGVYAKIRYF